MAKLRPELKHSTTTPGRCDKVTPAPSCGGVVGDQTFTQPVFIASPVHHRRSAFTAIATASLLALCRLSAGAPALPVPPLSPEQSLKKIHVPPGYRVELIAAEPLVLDPVAFDWDEHGRLWVVEMADYPLGLDGNGQPGGRIRVLEDTNGDGTYDRAALFAEGLSFPTGILTWRGGCLVTAAPDILFLEDTDGDGRADVHRPLFTGFNTGNQQLRINALRWGLDGWIYCANGGHNVNYGTDVKITSALTGAKVALGSRDFRFNPDTGEFDPLSGPAQFGRSRDAWGHWFGIQNSYPIWHYALEDRYLRRNPHVASPSPKVMMTPSNPRVFPAIEPDKRYHTFGQAGRFSSACGVHIVSDPLLFGENQTSVEHAFVCEPVHNLVQHLVVESDGNTFKARHVPAEDPDFFASADRWCRPVMIRTGPDGALWVADMYRYMVEHPHFLPANGQSELMPHYRAGDDRGRIYRVLPQSHSSTALPRLDPADPTGLVKLLSSSNGWLRDKAHMMLHWRRDKAVIPALTELARRSDRPLPRVHALHLLESRGALADELLIDAFHDAEPGVRERALVLAEHHTDDRLIAAAVKLAADPSAKVRLQLACTLGAWSHPAAGDALVALAQDSSTDALLRGAIASSLVPHLDIAARRFHGDADLLDATFQTAAGEEREDIMRTVMEHALPATMPADPAALHRARAALTLLRARNLTLEDLATKYPGSKWSALVARKNGIMAMVRGKLADGSVTEQAFHATLLLCDPKEQSAAVELLGRLIAPQYGLHPIAEYVTQLARIGDSRVPDLLLQDWAQRTPEGRSVILDSIMSREAWLPGLLARIQEGKLAASNFDAQRRARLLQHPAVTIRRQASSTFAAFENRSRQQVIEAYRPALALKGDAMKGKAVFVQTCTACHQLEGNGTPLGPDLRAVVDHAPEKLLVSILDPSADIQPGFLAYFCELNGGEQIYGTIASETGASIAFRLADGKTRAVTRAEIKSLQSSNVSLMPDGLEATLSPQMVTDLIAYLKNGN